ncbi:MAG: HAD-IIB family hydrolase, partial [Clostridiaceae bacterium]
AIMFPQGPEMIEKIKKELIEMGGLEVVSSGPDNIEIMAEGTSKGSGVKAFSEILGVDKKEIICIGDHENDISMVTYAGLGIAMGNAVDSLKKVADYVTDDNENSGVGKAINKFILNK